MERKQEAKSLQRPRTKGEVNVGGMKCRSQRRVLFSFCSFLANPSAKVFLALRSGKVCKRPLLLSLQSFYVQSTLTTTS